MNVYSRGATDGSADCAVNRRRKKPEKSVKKRLTNDNYGGNITKLSRETRVKTK